VLSHCLSTVSPPKYIGCATPRITAPSPTTDAAARRPSPAPRRPPPHNGPNRMRLEHRVTSGPLPSAPVCSAPPPELLEAHLPPESDDEDDANEHVEHMDVKVRLRVCVCDTSGVVRPLHDCELTPHLCVWHAHARAHSRLASRRRAAPTRAGPLSCDAPLTRSHPALQAISLAGLRAFVKQHSITSTMTTAIVRLLGVAFAESLRDALLAGPQQHGHTTPRADSPRLPTALAAPGNHTAALARGPHGPSRCAACSPAAHRVQQVVKAHVLPAAGSRALMDVEEWKRYALPVMDSPQAAIARKVLLGPWQLRVRLL
jgi:hypothetical protein